MKLILTDLDGTLLRTDKTISEYTKQILKQCQQKGILVGFCTSRGKKNITEYCDQIKPDIVICNGGACVYKNDKLLHSASFTLQETQTILQTAYKICGDNCEITLDTIDKIYWNRQHDKSTQYSDFALYDDFKDFSTFTETAMKICVQTDDEKKATQIANSISSCDYLPFSDIPWYKFSSKMATKEESIKILAQKLNINLSEIISFGDDFNDIGMLKLCGKGVAMQNAIPQVKEITSFITATNDEDGVAKFLEENLL